MRPYPEDGSRMVDGQALVLGGGGVAGIAWITGLLTGLAEAGQDVTGADLIVGTSAGATVAAQVGSGLPLDDLFARQTEPALQSREITVDVELDKFAAEWAEIMAGVTSAQDALRRVGAYALAADTVPEAIRRDVIESRLPSHDWPSRRILLVTVDAQTGEMHVFDRESGASLVDAVAASCAVPGIWPPVTIDGRRYVDGGVRSTDNADLAAGCGRIVVISPLGYNSPLPSPMPLREVVGRLRDGGSEVTVVAPDEASAAAIGANPLDPDTRVPAAEAGRAQGRGGLVDAG
jgi:NTE family protein